MPLRVKCKGCRRRLLLDDAFAGAYCRCRACRTFQSVPTIQTEELQLSFERASAPRMASAARVHANKTVDIAPDRRTVLHPSPMVWRMAAMFMISVGVSWTALVALNKTEPMSSGWPVAELESWEDQVRQADVREAFVGRPIVGSKVAFVFVGDDNDGPELRETATLADALCISDALSDVQFGVIQTREDGALGDMAAFLNEAKPIPVISSGLQKKDENAPVTAAIAFAAVRAWQPDQIMVVMSQPISNAQFAQARAEITAWNNVPASFFGVGRMLDRDLAVYGSELGTSIRPMRQTLLFDLNQQVGLLK